MFSVGKSLICFKNCTACIMQSWARLMGTTKFCGHVWILRRSILSFWTSKIGKVFTLTVVSLLSLVYSDSLLFIISIYRCRKLPKALKEWQAFLDLKKTIDDFNESCPLLEMMANKSMKRRHWDRIATLTGHQFDVESVTFTLQSIMEAPLLIHKDDIEVCCQFA